MRRNLTASYLFFKNAPLNDKGNAIHNHFLYASKSVCTIIKAVIYNPNCIFTLTQANISMGGRVVFKVFRFLAVLFTTGN